jgi:hypothetical protein
MNIRPLSAALVTLPLFVALACSSGSQRGTLDDGTGQSSASGGPGGGGPGGTFGDGGVQTTPADAVKYVPPTELGCPSRAQEILILDFRSGWWSGGGGGNYSGTALPAVVSSCPQTSVDYHHFETSMHVKCVYKTESGGGCQNLPAVMTAPDVRASFEKKAIGDYTQIWILSGSDEDQSDIHVGDALFKDLVSDTRGACIPMLVAAGDGFMTHANTMSKDLGMGDVFTQETKPPSFFSVQMMPAQAGAMLSRPVLREHLLFKGVDSLVDDVKSMFLANAHGDSLAASVPAPAIYDVIAKDSTGKPAIAVGAAKVSGDSYRPFIFDGGWQRTYVLGHAGTAQYLKNIVMYLGLVGCKAAPIGPVK